MAVSCATVMMGGPGELLAPRPPPTPLFAPVAPALASLAVADVGVGAPPLGAAPVAPRAGGRALLSVGDARGAPRDEDDAAEEAAAVAASSAAWQAATRNLSRAPWAYEAARDLWSGAELDLADLERLNASRSVAPVVSVAPKRLRATAAAAAAADEARALVPLSLIHI